MSDLHTSNEAYDAAVALCTSISDNITEKLEAYKASYPDYDVDRHCRGILEILLIKQNLHKDSI